MHSTVTEPLLYINSQAGLDPTRDNKIRNGLKRKVCTNIKRYNVDHVPGSSR